MHKNNYFCGKQYRFYLMNTDPQTIGIKQILKLSSVVDEYSLGEDFILGEASGSVAKGNARILETMKYPIRFDGFIIFFLHRGNISIDLNLNTYEVKEHSLLVVVPGNIIKIPESSFRELEYADIIFALLSREFVAGLKLDFNKVFQDSLSLLDNPCITLDDEQMSIAEDYFSLAKKVILSKQQNKAKTLGGLLSSLTYLAESLWTEQLSLAREKRMGASARKNQIFDRFIALITEYHTSERGMGFYADKLCLTPKYLSKIVKEASGRSGPDWIDAFVILEAKNLLRYSNMSIKEVVNALHFPNSSVFYKFFKSKTGQTPSEYRKEI